MSNRDLRTPIAVARDKFLDVFTNETMLRNPPRGRYLRNLLEMAFVGGWAEAEEHLRAALAPRAKGRGR